MTLGTASQVARFGPLKHCDSMLPRHLAPAYRIPGPAPRNTCASNEAPGPADAVPEIVVERLEMIDVDPSTLEAVSFFPSPRAGRRERSLDGMDVGQPVSASVLGALL